MSSYRRHSFTPPRWLLSTSALALVALVSARSTAQTSPDEQRADTLFNTAKQLQASGQLADACDLFAQSKRLAPGVGVALHLADCYERMGRTASAWQEFYAVERVARQRGDDKRADLARDRARALEPRLERLTLTASSAPHTGWQVTLDGVPLPADHWNAAMAMDPGEHKVVVNAPDQPPRTLPAHLDPANNLVTLSLDERAPAPTVTTSPPQASAAPVEAVTSSPASAPAPSHLGNDSWRVWAEVGLVGVTAAGVGFGSFFMVRRGHFIEEGPPADPELTNQATTAATVSFVAGGVALTSAFVLLFTTPSPKVQLGRTLGPAPASALHWAVVPTALRGGTGISLHATF
jgi:hypothetical protein